MTEPSLPNEHIVAANSAAVDELGPNDAEEAASRRGFVAGPDSDAICDESGEVVWSFDAYRFLEQRRPDSVHPGLWHHTRLLAAAGLYEVCEGIYQVRGFDISNMTLIEGEQGVIVVDPLVSVETARAALILYYRHRGHRPVTTVVCTHNHVDHFGGIHGVVTRDDLDGGAVDVVAPDGFVDHAASENVYTGTVMKRRASYMYGSTLDAGPHGRIGVGLGLGSSSGRVTLATPTVTVTHTGQEHTIDGVRMVFQLAADTEAPAELNFFLPERAALCVAETATHSQHNLGTLRGAPVRDAHAWARSLTETIELFGDRVEVLFAGHHWPTWGSPEVAEFLGQQRDLYAYLHDQTLRLMNQGLTAPEIAEVLRLPPELTELGHTRGYYGSTSHNIKAIYQRYIGWFDGNPAHLWPHSPGAAAERYVRFMGGSEQVLAMARESYAEGDYRWVAEVVNHVVQAEPDNTLARRLQAAALEQLGYGSENATWRNFYLTGAQELRNGQGSAPGNTADRSMLAALSVPQLFDSLAVRIDGPRAAGQSLHIAWQLTDDQTIGWYHTVLSRGALVHSPSNPVSGSRPELTVTVRRAVLNQLVARPRHAETIVESEAVGYSGDLASLRALVEVVQKPNPRFGIVAPIDVSGAGSQ